MSKHFGVDFKEEFDKVDKDRSGKISGAEFRRYVMNVLPERIENEGADRPTNRQLLMFAANSAIPFVVFGFLDNSIMIVGGDVVDDLIGSTLQLSTLACAAVANTFADVLGISVGNTVERHTGRLGLDAKLTSSQAKLPFVRRLGLVSGSLGILVGCILGMTPLLFIDQEAKAMRDTFAKMDVDGNGYLCVNELKTVLAVAGIVVGEADLARILHVLDLDKDGKVSQDEFLGSVRKIKELLAKKATLQ